MSEATKELIAELRNRSGMETADVNARVNLMDRAADALEARQPTEDDRESILSAMKEGWKARQQWWTDAEDVSDPPSDDEFLADSILAARAAVPDAATADPRLTGGYQLGVNDIPALVAQIDRLETVAAQWKQRDEATMKMLYLAQAERDAAIAAVERVRVIHADGGASQGRTNEGYGYLKHCCVTCGEFGEYGVEYPCPTIAALDGAPEPEWEYGTAHTDDPCVGATESSRRAAEVRAGAWNEATKTNTGFVVRRRKAGPWLPIEKEQGNA